MSGLAGVPDAAWGLAGRASRAFPNSASAPQGSPCEFALCCYFFGISRKARVRQCTGNDASRGAGACFEVGRDAGGAAVRGPRGVVWRTRGARARRRSRETRALTFRRARVSPRDGAPVEATGFSPRRSRKSEQKTNARIGTRGLPARFANARGLARAGASWRVPSLSRRERMRACFGSLDVAPRQLNAPGVPREEKAMNEKTKNLCKKGRKRAGRDSTLMWTARG